MKSSCFIIVLFAGLSISIFESISLGHNEGGTGINSKRECGGSMSDGCNQGCHQDSQCLHHCGKNQRPYCSTSGHCQCTALSISFSESNSSEHSQRGSGGGSQRRGGGKEGPGIDGRNSTGCHQHLDCHSHYCSNNQRPFCSQGQCHCRECNENSQCWHHCGNNQRPYCSSGGHCHCRETTTTTTTATTTTTTTPTPTTATTTRAPTTNPDPTTVDPHFQIKCTTHTECSSHVCPAGQHPYCSFGQRSSDCQCTVCTDDSHCFCPAGLVGKCHFNYFDRSYSCVCGFAPDTTTQHKETTTVPSTTAQHETTTAQQTTLALALPATTTLPRLTCPSQCDTNLTCVWDQVCSPGEVCMLRQYHNSPFIVHCSKSDDCKFMKMVVGAEITCCEHLQCVTNILH